jgi:acetyl-CoA carboxylase biotin carboxylase subunit
MAFKNPAVYVEKVLERARHVEVQVLADQHGNVVHLGERDCSIQRRFQKLVEETPSPGITADLRERLTRAATRIASAVGYTSAGTCEFLVDEGGRYYFIEMNARLQVEHPVTEQVTGVDLVKEQIRIAAGEPLSLQQKRIEFRGAAIECRINAEDASKGFRPSPGIVHRIIPPGGPGVRFDSHVHVGYTVTQFYDSLIGKLIVHQPTREEAIASMKRSLRELRIEGVKTTVPLHLEILNHPAFCEARIDTTFIERSWPS